jgi:hypothetical protein
MTNPEGEKQRLQNQNIQPETNNQSLSINQPGKCGTPRALILRSARKTMTKRKTKCKARETLQLESKREYPIASTAHNQFRVEAPTRTQHATLMRLEIYRKRRRRGKWMAECRGYVYAHFAATCWAPLNGNFGVGFR